MGLAERTRSLVTGFMRGIFESRNWDTSCSGSFITQGLHWIYLCSPTSRGQASDGSHYHNKDNDNNERDRVSAFHLEQVNLTGQQAGSRQASHQSQTNSHADKPRTRFENKSSHIAALSSQGDAHTKFSCSSRDCVGEDTINAGHREKEADGAEKPE